MIEYMTPELNFRIFHLQAAWKPSHSRNKKKLYYCLLCQAFTIKVKSSSDLKGQDNGR